MWRDRLSFLNIPSEILAFPAASAWLSGMGWSQCSKHTGPFLRYEEPLNSAEKAARVSRTC